MTSEAVNSLRDKVYYYKKKDIAIMSLEKATRLANK